MSWSDIAKQVEARMTPALAERVKALRVNEDTGSWREVSDRVFGFPEASVLADWTDMKGQQALGMYLCEAAAHQLGEDPMKEPWN